MKISSKKILAGLSLTIVLLASACAKKNSSSQGRGGTAARGDVAAAGTAQTLGITKCADGVSNTTGRIFNDSAVGDSFRQAWVDFFSATMNGTDIGELSGLRSSTNQGVNLDLRLKIVNGQLSYSESKMQIQVKDGMVGQKDPQTGALIEMININFSSAKTGQLSNANGSGTFTMVFSDTYGEITLTGSYNQQVATGTVSFVNTKHYNKETPKSGTLGNFSLNSCGLFF